MDSHLCLGVDEKVIRRLDLIKVVKWIIVAVIFAFLGRMVWGNWSEVKDASFTFRAFPFIWGTLIFTFSYFIQLWAWYLITARLGIALSFRETLRSWFYSQLGKYLPGKVWLLVSRFYFYESRGKSRKTISVALYFETVTIITTAGLLCLGFLHFFRRCELIQCGRVIGMACVVVYSHFCLPPSKGPSETIQWAFTPIKEGTDRLVPVLWGCPLDRVCLPHLLGGGRDRILSVHGFGLPRSRREHPFPDGGAGLFKHPGIDCPVCPRGLGVREGALVYLLSFIMPSSVAVVLSVLTRLWMTLIEIGLIGVIYLFSQFGTHRRERIPMSKVKKTGKPDEKAIPSKIGMDWRRLPLRHLIAIGLMAGVALAAYSNTFDAPFHFDDLPNILQNPLHPDPDVELGSF